MSNGLTYYRYDNNPKFNNYDSATNFSIFESKPDGNGTISIIQNNNNSNKLYYDYGFNKNQYIAVKLKGFFTPDISGIWSFQLGDTNPNDDLCYIWIGDNALNPTPENASGMTYYYSSLQTVKINLIAGIKYPILIYWGQSWGGLVFSIGIIPPNGILTYDGSKYYSGENGLTYYRYDDNYNFNNYNSATNFSIFNKPSDGSGIISKIQNNNDTNKLYSTYGFFKNEYIALKLKGFFTPDVSGIWSFQLGDSIPNDDLNYIWIGDNALNPTPENASGMTYYYSPIQTVKVTLIGGVKYPILIYWGQSYGGFVFSIGIIPPNGQLTYDGSKYYSISNELCNYQLNQNELLCYQKRYPNDLTGIPNDQLQKHWSTIGCNQKRNNLCPVSEINGSYQYKGCYTKSKVPPNKRSNISTIDDCRKIAERNRESIFSVTNYNECWTGSDNSFLFDNKEIYNSSECGTLGLEKSQNIYFRDLPFPPNIPYLRSEDFSDQI